MQATVNPAQDQAGTPTRCRDCGADLPAVYAWDEPSCPTCVSFPVDDQGDAVGQPTVGATLREVVRYLAKHGWVQCAYYDSTGGSFTPPSCLVGALGMVCYGGPVDAPAQMFDDPAFARFEATLTYLDGFLTDEYGQVAYEFNDARGRSFEAVVYALLKAADQWSLAYQEHADYPHTPGTLCDCPVCEAECFCRDGFTCVHCDIEAEGEPMVGGGE
jgi:hypothetical protein